VRLSRFSFMPIFWADEDAGLPPGAAGFFGHD
jgi:hypothetical protein